MAGRSQLVHLYAERGSPKYEKAALRWLERYLTEGSPRLQHFADLTRASQDALSRPGQGIQAATRPPLAIRSLACNGYRARQVRRGAGGSARTPVQPGGDKTSGGRRRGCRACPPSRSRPKPARRFIRPGGGSFEVFPILGLGSGLTFGGTIGRSEELASKTHPAAGPGGTRHEGGQDLYTASRRARRAAEGDEHEEHEQEVRDPLRTPFGVDPVLGQPAPGRCRLRALVRCQGRRDHAAGSGPRLLAGRSVQGSARFYGIPVSGWIPLVRVGKLWGLPHTSRVLWRLRVLIDSGVVEINATGDAAARQPSRRDAGSPARSQPALHAGGVIPTPSSATPG